MQRVILQQIMIKTQFIRVSAFVDSYNNLLKKSEDSNTNGILNAVSSMVRITDPMKSCFLRLECRWCR